MSQQQQTSNQQQTNEIFINFVSDKHQDRSSSYNITVSSSKNDQSPPSGKETLKSEIEDDKKPSVSSSGLVKLNTGPVNVYSNETSSSSGGLMEQSASDLAQLKRKRKSLNKQFNCDQCDAKFNQKIHLTKHSAKHTGIKPFKCTECNYSTVERSHLKVHIRIHTGEKPFKCTYCEYATAQSSTLKIHKKRHHNDSTPSEAGGYMVSQQPMWTATGNMSSENGNNKIQLNLMRNYDMVDVDDDDEEEARTFDDDHGTFTGDESSCSNRLVVDCDVNNNNSNDGLAKRSSEVETKPIAKPELDKYEGPLDCRKKFFLNTQKRMKMEKMESESGGASGGGQVSESEKKAAENRLLGLANVALESETF